MNTGLKTSEYSNVLCPESFLHRRYLKTKTNSNDIWLHNARKMPTLIIPSIYILMNIIAQKYVFKPSAIKSGENTSHHPDAPKK